MPSNFRILIVSGLLKVIQTWSWLLLEINQIWWRQGRWRQRQVLHLFLSLLFTMFGALFTLLWPCQTLCQCKLSCWKLTVYLVVSVANQNALVYFSLFWICCGVHLDFGFSKERKKKEDLCDFAWNFCCHYNDAGSPSICSGEWSFFHGNLCEDCNKCQWYILWNR